MYVWHCVYQQYYTNCIPRELARSYVHAYVIASRFCIIPVCAAEKAQKHGEGMLQDKRKVIHKPHSWTQHKELNIPRVKFIVFIII